MVEDGILYNKDKTTILYYPRTLTTADGSFSTSANIGPYAFYKTLLKKITITDGAKTIGDYAFSQCPRLEEVVIADSVTEIGEYAFAAANMNGNVLKSVILPSSLSAISNNMFAYCTNLPTITIPKNVTVIGNAAFSVCYALQSVKILGEILSIGKSAFTQCSSLKEINLPDSVTSIGSGAFEGDSELVITVLPRNLTTINTEAFMNCSLLNISSLPGTVTHIGRTLLHNYPPARAKTEKIPCLNFLGIPKKIDKNSSSGNVPLFLSCWLIVDLRFLWKTNINALRKIKILEFL